MCKLINFHKRNLRRQVQLVVDDSFIHANISKFSEKLKLKAILVTGVSLNNKVKFYSRIQPQLEIRSVDNENNST